MESSNHNASKKSLIEEDANISTFRRRNNIIILIFFFLIISLALITAALITTLLTARNDSAQPRISPIEAYCFVSDNQLCLTALNPIINNKFISNPNQIFAISLHAAAKSLQRITELIPFCTQSMHRGLDRIRDPLERLRVNPFVESLSDEERGDMMRRITAAEEDVMSCLINLADVEAAAADLVGVAAAELREVTAYLDAAGDFLIGFDEALQMYEADNGVDRRMICENLFGICLCGLQMLFIFCLYYLLLFRTR